MSYIGFLVSASYTFCIHFALLCVVFMIVGSQYRSPLRQAVEVGIKWWCEYVQVKRVDVAFQPITDFLDPGGNTVKSIKIKAAY